MGRSATRRCSRHRSCSVQSFQSDLWDQSQPTARRTGFGSGESHQSSVLSQIPANQADSVQVQNTESRSTKNGQCSFADVESIDPSALSESSCTAGSFSAQQTVAGCHSPRAWTVLSHHREASMRE